MEICKTELRKMLQDGWVISYEPDTRFIGASHPRGGRQSICEIRHPYHCHEIGREIADAINLLYGAKAQDVVPAGESE